jgi:SAM-dependent methyltransferase
MTAHLPAGAADGVYARKQLQSASAIVSWSHRRRFDVALSLAASARGKRVLDYGCGDGSFLAMLVSSADAPLDAVGAEIARDLVENCRARLATDGIRFLHLAELDRVPANAFDVIFCMEVLEHVPNIDEVLDRLDRLLAPGGQIVMSVPVETGLPMLVKQAARRIAGWRGIGDYPGTEPYRPSEWLSTLFAGSRQHIRRRVLVNPDGTPFHDHKGFNWMALRRRLEKQFTLGRVLSSPFTWLPPHLGTQAWFLLQKRDVRRCR